jgi:ABC-type transport system involved in multi-copper enzyme maturation permease subunit
MRQFSADFRRFWARRLMRVFVLGAIAIAALSIGYSATQGHKPSASEIQQFHSQFGNPPVILGPDGRRLPPEDVYGLGPQDTRLNVHDKLPVKIDGAGQTLLFVALVLGASFVGADFNAGSLTSQLLYEPRRWRLYLAKGMAVFVGCVLFSLGMTAFVALVTWIGASIHGVTSGVDGAWINARLVQTTRLAVVVGLAGVMAYTVALLTKRTAAAVIIFLAQVPLMFMINPQRGPFHWLSHYSPMRALMVLATPITRDSGDEFLVAIRTHQAAAVLVVVWTVVLLGISGLVFSRAEVR